MTLLERLKPEYQNHNWSFDSLKIKLDSITTLHDLTLGDIWMMEHEFLLSFRDLTNLINFFNHESN